MQDPMLSIKDILYDNWDLTGRLDKDKIAWFTFRMTTGLDKPTIEIQLGDHRKKESGGADPRVMVYQEIFIIPKDVEGDYQQANLWAMRKEIESIIEDNREEATDLDFINYSPETARGYRVDWPFKSFEVDIIVSYEKE